MDVNWKSMDSAPKDGTVILTDEGSCVWDKFEGWCLADTEGWIPSCAEEGRQISVLTPTVWAEYPQYKGV